MRYPVPPPCLRLHTHDLVSLLLRHFGHSVLEGDHVHLRPQHPTSLCSRILALSDELKAALCVWPPCVAHRVLVRTSIHDAKAFAAFRNSWASRPSLRPTHSRALPDHSFSVTNFLSCSTPPKSAKQNRLEVFPLKETFGNAPERKLWPKGNFFVLGNFFRLRFCAFWNDKQSRLFEKEKRVQERTFSFSSEPAKLGSVHVIQASTQNRIIILSLVSQCHKHCNSKSNNQHPKKVTEIIFHYSRHRFQEAHLKSTPRFKDDIFLKARCPADIQLS